MNEEPILREIEKNRIKNWEIFLQNTEINERHLEKNKPSFFNKTLSSGYGIRIHTRGLSFSSSNVFEPVYISRIVKDSLKTSKIMEKVDFQFTAKQKFQPVKIVDKNIKNNPDGVINDYIEQLLQKIDSDVMISFGKIRTFDTHIRIINSEGVDVEREETNFMLELSLIVEKGGRKTEFWPHEYRRRAMDLPPQIDVWSKFAKDQFEAEFPKTEKTTVIFSPSTILDGLGSVLDLHSSGAAKVNEISKLTLGEKVAVECLTVISDGLYPFGLMTSSFDDEGVPQRKIPIIEKGVFKNYIYDQFYGLKDGVESTGNGLRQSSVFFIFDSKYASQPSNQISNFYVKPGNSTLENMISEVRHGVLVESFSWLSPDATTGKFSSEIRTGYYIQNGEIAKPLKGGLVTGNFFDMMKDISGISNDSRICSGGTLLAGICPYIRFENVQIAGI